MKEIKTNYVVIDTNILISGLIFPNSKPYCAIRKALTEYQLCASQETFQEFVDVASRPKFAKYFTSQEKEAFISTILDVLTFVEITEKITDCQDPKDNKFLEVAVCANAKYLVTGDKKRFIAYEPI